MHNVGHSSAAAFRPLLQKGGVLREHAHGLRLAPVAPTRRRAGSAGSGANF